MSNQRPRVTAWFVEADERGEPLLLAMGRVISAVAGLEGHLKLELSRFISERAVAEGSTTDKARRQQLDVELSRLQKLTGGQALDKLRKFGLPAQLEERIGRRSTEEISLFTT